MTCLTAPIFLVWAACAEPTIYKNNEKVKLEDLSRQERFAFNGALVRCGFIYGHKNRCLSEFHVLGPREYKVICQAEKDNVLSTSDGP